MKIGFNTNQNIPKTPPTNFRGKSNLGHVAEDISKKSSWFPKFLTYLGQNDGEILNTVVTAVGTAAVAPIFIAANPFSKEDKETKWYSALRQPISAIIAVIMQIWVNKEFNNFMDKGGSTGRFGDAYDLRAMPKSKYLKRIIKLEHPEYTEKQISAEIASRQMQAERRRTAELRKEMKGKNISYNDLLCKDSYDDAKKQLTKEFKEAHKNELNCKNQNEYSEFIEKNLSKENINKRALENIEKSVEAEAKAKFKIRELAKQFSSVDEAICNLNESLKTVSNKSEEKIIKNVIERLETIKLYEESKSVKPFSTIKDIGKTYEEVLHNVKVKRLLKAKTSDAAKSLSKANKILGIVVSLVTLPISCGALNWAYPRVMEKVMPVITPWLHKGEKTNTENIAKDSENIKNIEEEDYDED